MVATTFDLLNEFIGLCVDQFHLATRSNDVEFMAVFNELNLELNRLRADSRKEEEFALFVSKVQLKFDENTVLVEPAVQRSGNNGLRAGA